MPMSQEQISEREAAWQKDKMDLARQRQEVTKIPFVVRMLAFHEEESDPRSGRQPQPPYRVVEVPLSELGSDEKNLDKIFYYGQNDFQNKSSENCCSLSVGDVIFLGSRPFVIQSFGFKELTPEELQTLENTDRRDRSFHELVRPKPKK